MSAWRDWINDFYCKATSFSPCGGDYDDGYISVGSPHHRIYLDSIRWHKFGSVMERAMFAAYIEHALKVAVSNEEAIVIEARAVEIAAWHDREC